MKGRLLWLVMVCCPWPVWSATTSSQFVVTLELRYREKCTSETLSEQTNALVQVVCRSGNFVSIDPVPGKPFLGTHGGAFRYSFGPLRSDERPLVGVDGSVSPYIGYGTITGLRVFNPYGAEDPFELVISY